MVVNYIIKTTTETWWFLLFLILFGICKIFAQISYFLIRSCIFAVWITNRSGR